MLKICKRVFLFILCFILMLPGGVLSASAESSICTVTDNVKQLSTTVSSEGLTVFGYFGGKSGYPVTVTVKDTEREAFVCAEQVTTGKDGYYTLLIPYEAEMLGKNYKVSARCITDNNIYEKTLAFLPGIEPQALLQLMNEATAEEMAGLIGQYGVDAGISVSALNRIDNPTAVYEALAGREYATINEFRESFNAEIDIQEQITADVFSIHVAPYGCDTNAATVDSPLKSIEAAMTYADYLMTLGSEDNFEILLHGGEYRIEKDIVIEKKPERKNHITIRNFNGEQPVLNGSCAIYGWEPYTGNIYRARVPMGLDIKVLFENSEMLTYARYPNKQASYENLYDEFLQADNYNNSKKQFIYKEESHLPQITDTSALEVGIFAGGGDGYFMWQMNVIRVDELDTEQRLVTLSDNASYAIGTGSYYFWQGALELLDAPGEFYHDAQNGYVYYYPTDGSMEGKTVSYPVVSNMLTIGNGDGSTISDITVEGIGICCTDRSKNIYIYGKTNEYGNGIRILNAKNIAVKDCEIYATGGNGIIADKNLEDSEISGNHIYGGGQGGILLIGDEGVKNNNLIDNNYIHHLNRIIHSESGIAIRGEQTDGNTASHNRIHDLKRIGISIDRSAGDNIIEYNDISACCTGSDDSGFIYMSLITGTTTVRHNYLHDGYSRGSYRAVYPDEAAHHTIVEGNLIARMEGSCTHVIQAKGDDIQIKNNYLVDNPNAGSNLTSYMRWESGQHTERMVIENNVFYNSGKTMHKHYFVDKSEKRIESSDKNLYYNSDRNYVFKFEDSGTKTKSYSSLLWYQFAGYEQGSKAADPMFISNNFGDYRYSYSSPAVGLGIKALKLGKMGLKADFKYGDGDTAPVNLFVRDSGENGNSGYITLDVGETVQLSEVVRNKGGFVIPDAEITYHAEETNNAVTLNGSAISGIRTGTVRVTATAQTATGSVSCDFDVIVASGNTENAALELQSRVVTDADGQVLNKLESGTLNIQLSVKAKENTTAKAFAAFVDKGGILRAVGESADMTLTKNMPADISAEITVPENVDGELYVFIWDGAETLKPLYEKMHIF